MSITERIAAVANDPQKTAEVVPFPQVQSTIDQSALPSILNSLPEGWKSERIITEEGKKVVFDIKWEKGGVGQRATLSVREGRVAFMGDCCKPHYLVLEGKDIEDQKKVEEYFLQTVANPQILSR